jgi:hypothetical protein
MTVALVANIARPISSALSTAFSADSYGLLSAYGKLGAAADPDAVIKALFANSEVGAWYDPSDLTTMFKDRAGSTPVTADGQTVGLILDKSKGLVLGPELVTNGEFSNGTTGWGQTNATLSVSSGALLVNSTGNYGIGSSNGFSTVIGRTYKTSVKLVSCSAATARIRVITDPYDFNSLVVHFVNSSAWVPGQVFTLYFTATTTTTYIAAVTDVNPSSISIDDVTCKEIPGNHATALSDAGRPLYKTSGGLHWLQFDGVDDYLSPTLLNLGSAYSMFTGIEASTVAVGDRTVFSQRSNITGQPIKCSLDISGDLLRAYIRDDGVTGGECTYTILANTKYVTLNDYTAGAQKLRVNAVQRMTKALTLGTTSVNRNNIGANALSTTTEFLNGHVYSLIIRGALSTTQEITDTETWVNGKTGAY